MKKLYSILILAFMAGALNAQTDVTLQIHHMLGATPFQFNAGATNNNNVPFNVSRLEYYISQITLIHDGGQQTMVPNTWILADAGSTTVKNLGSFNFTTLEGIKMGIGVEASVNHLDPSSYAFSHPLAPKSPSMHWGWSAGYRFVAMEGKSGSNFSQTYEIHALEDDYYYQTTVTTNGIPTSNGLVISLNADYEMALKDIDVSTGPITHGGFGESITLLQNFRDEVFSASTTVGIENDLVANAFTVYPNPAAASRLVKIAGNFSSEATISIADLSGRIITEIPANAPLVTLQLPQAGYYLVTLREDQKTLATRKLIVTD